MVFSDLFTCGRLTLAERQVLTKAVLLLLRPQLERGQKI